MSLFPHRNGRGRRRFAVTTLAAVTALATVTGLASCSNGDGPTPHELTYLESLPFQTLYPPTAGYYPNGGVVNNITDRLLWQDPDTLELYPWIADRLLSIRKIAGWLR